MVPSLHLLWNEAHLPYIRMHSKLLLNCHNSFPKVWWINEFDRLTVYLLILVYYIFTGKLLLIKSLADKMGVGEWINKNLLYIVLVTGNLTCNIM